MTKKPVGEGTEMDENTLRDQGARRPAKYELTRRGATEWDLGGADHDR
jgi:hypothetical protein